MYLTRLSNDRYLKTAIVLLLSVFVSLSSVSASAASKRKHSHKHHHTVVIHEVYVFNPRPVFTQDGKIIRNNISFNPQPIITVPTAPAAPLPSCGTVNSAPAAAPNQSVQFNIHN